MPLTHPCKIPIPSIPVFQHSNCERSELSSIFYNYFLYLSYILEVWRRIVRFFHLEIKAFFSAHGKPDFDHRHLPALESHDSASMGKLRFPCDIIVVTLVAGDGHEVGYGSLVSGCCGRPSYGFRVACYATKIRPIRNPQSQIPNRNLLSSVLCNLSSVFCLVPLPGMNPQTHVLQHPPGTLTILLIIGFTGFNDGLNDLVTDPVFF